MSYFKSNLVFGNENLVSLHSSEFIFKNLKISFFVSIDLISFLLMYSLKFKISIVAFCKRSRKTKKGT